MTQTESDSSAFLPPPEPQHYPVVSPPLPRPTLEPERVGSIDALRGVAVLGILLLNIQSFAMPGAAYMNPTAYGDLTGANWWVWVVSHVLADQKFMTIFSMLFGAGIVLMTTGQEQRTGRSAAIHYRRMGWLILFGVLHAHLLWYGDILYFYGMCGLAAYLFRNFRPGWLMGIGLVVVAVPSLIFLTGALTLPMWGEEAVAGFNAEMNPSPDRLDAEIAAYRGSWLEQMPQRILASLSFETAMFAIWGGWRAGGLMLIGMALYKWGIFSGRRSGRFYALLTLLGLGIGIPVVAYGVKRNFEESWYGPYFLFTGSQFNYWASILVSLGYVGLVMLLAKTSGGSTLLKPFAAVGRMALTNYLMHTIICTTIFYGHGFGLFGTLERTEQLMVVVAIWIAQLIWSPLWLSKFRFGPFEWLWRSLTYLKPQPMLR
jgi:uncharacterized protein